MNGFHIQASPIVVWAARGGHGATTLAGALGSLLGMRVEGHEPDAFEWMWATDGPEPGPGPCPLLLDRGVLTVPMAGLTNMVALRGPCSLGLTTIAPIVDRIDHLVVIREPWRAIRREDVEAALSVKVAAEVAHSPRVARLADAGLLSGRVAELDEFAELKEWATATWPVRSADSPPATGRPPKPPLS